MDRSGLNNPCFKSQCLGPHFFNKWPENEKVLKSKNILDANAQYSMLDYFLVLSFEILL